MDLKTILKELQRHWAEVVEVVRVDSNINTVTIHGIEDNIILLSERSYAMVFPPGKVREEVLAKTARQCAEVRTLINEFTRDLTHRCAALSFEDQHKFVSNRYLTLYSPIMMAFDGTETGTVPGGVSFSDIRDTDPRDVPRTTSEAKNRRPATRLEPSPHGELAPPMLPPPQLPPAATFGSPAGSFMHRA